MRRRSTDREALTKELASLRNLDLGALKDQWRKLYVAEPPARFSRLLLTLSIAYRLQERTLGGTKPVTRRLLSRAADVAGGRIEARSPIVKLKPGTRLLREWQGITHEVIILEDQVLFRGQRHRSLSEVARLITGSRWSGPLFFGLKGTARDDHHGVR
jgi:hypothetical protein